MPLIRLFHMAVPGRIHARTFRCLWLLEELEVTPFEVCMVTPGQPYVPQLREYGMRQVTKLPALSLDGQEIGESGVICQILAERFNEKINLLGNADERIELLQWIGFAETCVMLRVPYMPLLLDPSKDIDAIRTEVIEPQWQVLAGNIEKFESHFRERQSPYLMESGFSVADTMCGWSLYTFHSWGLMDLATGNSPLTLAYLERLRARPAFNRAEKYAELEPGLHER